MFDRSNFKFRPFKKSSKKSAPKKHRSHLEILEPRHVIGSMLPFYPGGSMLPSLSDTMVAKLPEIFRGVTQPKSHEVKKANICAPDSGFNSALDSIFDRLNQAAQAGGSGSASSSSLSVSADFAAGEFCSVSDLDTELSSTISSDPLSLRQVERPAEESIPSETPADPAMSDWSAASSALSGGVSTNTGSAESEPETPLPTLSVPAGTSGGGGSSEDPTYSVSVESSEPAALADAVTPERSGAPKSDDSSLVQLAGNEAADDTPLTLNFSSLDDWTVTEEDGSADYKGRAELESKAIRLYEGDSFITEAVNIQTVPAGTSTFSFSYLTSFDSSDSTSINDAFEVAVLDKDGYSLVDTFSPNRDAYFNVTEGVEAKGASGVTIEKLDNGFTCVTVDLSSVPDDIEASFLFRLVNNDTDTGSWVELRSGSKAYVDIEPLTIPVSVEGSTVTATANFTGSGTKPEDYSVSFVWGDGSTSTGSVTETADGFTAIGEHIYADNGNYDVNLTIEIEGVSSSVSAAASVSNAAPEMTPLTLSFTAELDGAQVRQYAILSGTFTDPGFTNPAAGTEETFTVTVNWGDGITETLVPQVVQGEAGRLTIGSFELRHQYTESGIYEAVVTVQDDDGGTDSETFKFGYGEIEICQAVEQDLTTDQLIERPVWSSWQHGVVPVIVKSSGNFDATQIDTATVRFYPGEAADDNGYALYYDVAPFKDGTADAIYHFSTWESQLRPTDKIGYVTGSFADGTPFFGFDTIPATPLSGVIPDSFDSRTAADSGTRFFVADSGPNLVYRYKTDGTANSDFPLSVSTTDPRDITANEDGSILWVVDGSGQVELRSPDGWLLDSWYAAGVVSPQGIATDGTDIWIADSALMGICRYTGAASTESITVTPNDFFPLHPENISPTGMATDGTTIWVSDDFTDTVFTYSAVSGEYLGQWKLDPQNADAAGITNDPTGASDSLWVVDAKTLRVYEYAAATTVFAGTLTAVSSFALASGNTNPTGIADPKTSTKNVTVTVTEPENGTDIAAGTTILISGNVSSAGGTAPGQSYQIDFESIPSGKYTEGTVITDQYFDQYGVTFSTEEGDVTLALVSGEETAFSSEYGPDTPADTSTTGEGFLTFTAVQDETVPSFTINFSKGYTSVSGDLLDVDTGTITTEVFYSDGSDAWYNDSIGTILDGTSYLFPVAPSDPTYYDTEEPDLSPAADILGDWLTAGPPPENGYWNWESIPTAWTAPTENAIVYEIDGGPGGIEHLQANLDVDNGIFVWLNGEFKFGAMAPYAVHENYYEYTDIDFGVLKPGKNYLQVLREDQGDINGSRIQILGEVISAESWLIVGYNDAGLSVAVTTIDMSSSGAGDGGSVAWELVSENSDITCVKFFYIGNKTEKIDTALDNLSFTLKGKTVTDPVAAVLVNGESVNVLDAAGNYFYQTTVQPGLNEYNVIALTASGQKGTASISVFGTTEGDGTVEELQFETSPSFKPSYARTSFDARTNKLYAELAIENVGTYSSQTPFYVGVTNISSPLVTLLDYVGITQDGIPYYDISDLIIGSTFDPNEITAYTDILFSNPSRVQFDYDLVFVYQTNNAPAFITVPELNAYLDTEYVYASKAVDPDGDNISYSLIASPKGMTIERYTGKIEWTPTPDSLGSHTVTIQADDGRGGTALQTYTITVTELPPNRPPVITSFPETDVTIGSVTVSQNEGLTDPEYIIMKGTDTISETVSLTLGDIEGALTSVDVVFVVDESGSMAGEHAWLQDMIVSLDAAFEYAGIRDNRYGLVGFADTPRTLSVSSNNFMTAEEFLEAAQGLSTSRSGYEDGYRGIQYVFDNYTFRQNAVSVIVLVTDENRDTTDKNCTYQTTLNELISHDTVIFSVLNAKMQNSKSQRSLGVDNWKNAYIPAGDSCILTAGGQYIGSEYVDGGEDRIKHDYIDLSWEAGGSAWDLNLLRAGGTVATQFSNTFVDVLKDEVIRRIPVTVTVDPGVEGFTNLTGILENRTPGELVSFDIEIDPNRTPDSFFIYFENADTGERLGKIPVCAADRGFYIYDVEAVDPDNDPLTYSLTDAPEGMKIDSETGLIVWSASAAQIGTHEVTVEVSDGRGGIDSQTFTIEVIADPTNHAPVIVSEPVMVTMPTDNQEEYCDLSSWTQVVFWSDDSNPEWTLSENNTVATQHHNAKPSILLSDFNVLNQEINGTWYTSDPDDDFMGFVFGYQDASHFYLFDWKGGTQNWRDWGTALAGMSVKCIDSDGTIDASNLWGTENREDVTLLYHNSIQWQHNVEYTFNLKFQNGAFIITVSQGDTVLDSIAITDDTYSNGLFGFYNFSQGSVQYTGFTRKELMSYAYTAVAIDADDDPLTYSLLSAPDGMTINAKTGLIAWNPGKEDIGSHTVTLQVSDGRGGYDTQTYTLHVRAAGGGAISGHVVNDANKNGVQDEGEGYLANQLVWLDQNQNGKLDVGEITTYSDDNGYYIFTDLPEDIYYVRYQALNGWVQTFPTEGSWDPEENIVVNGSFEDFPETESSEKFIEKYAPCSEIAGWVVTSGSVSLHNTTYEKSYTGKWSLDLQGQGPGTISQTLETVPGQKYYLQYAVAGNLAEGPTIKRYTIDADDESTYQEFDTTGHTEHEMGWEVRSWSFTAENSETVLVFSGLDNTPCGAVLDNVIVAPIDESTIPGGYTILLYDNMVAANRDFGAYNEDSGVNNNPIILSTAPTYTDSGSLYRYDVSAIDPDGDTLTYSLLAFPDGMTIHPDLGVIVWQPKSDQIGTVQAIVKVADGRGGVATQMFAVTVEKPNTAPVITTETIPSPILAGSPYQAQIQAQDADGNALSFTLADDAPAGMMIDEDTGLITWTPSESDISSEDKSFTVVVSDGKDAVSRSYLYRVTETLPNDAPVITSQPRTCTRFDFPYVYLVQAYDPNGDPITYSLETAPDEMTIDSETGQISWTPDSRDLGRNSIVIAVSDNRGAVTRQSFTLEVVTELENSAPRIISNPPLISVLGKSYVYNPEAYDAEGDVLMWRLDTAPEEMSISYLTGEICWTPKAADRGTHHIVLRVMDAYGAYTTQTFDITVRGANHAPLIVSNPITTASIGQNYLYAVQARDEDGDAIEFSLIDAPEGMTIDSETGIILWTPSEMQIGSYAVTIRAKDAYGGFDAQRFTIEAGGDPKNGLPTFTSTPVWTAATQHLYTYQAAAIDPEGDIIRYSLDEESLARGMSIDAETGLISWKPTNSHVGTWTVTITAESFVEDEDGTLTPNGAGYQSYALSVRKNQNPRITSRPVTSATAGGNYFYSYDVTASDADGDKLYYTLVDGPEGMTIDDLGRIRWTPTLDMMGTAVSVTVMVDDGYDGKASQTYSIEIMTDDIAPEVELAGSTNLIKEGDSIDFTAAATDNIGVQSIFLVVDGQEYAMNEKAGTSVRSLTFTFTEVGVHNVFARAYDYAGNVGESSVWKVRILDPEDEDCPQVTIHAFIPQVYDAEQGKLVDGERIEIDELQSWPTLNYITDAEISIYDPNIDNWYIEYGAANLVGDYASESSNWVTFASGTGNIDHERFQIDTTLLSNDIYYLRVTAFDVNGQGWHEAVQFSVSSEAKLGQFSFTMTDISLARNGISINVSRTYDTLKANQEGDFGYGWSMSICDPKIVETTLAGSEMQEGDRVYITTPDGERVGFTYTPEKHANSPDNEVGIGIFLFAIAYTPKFEADKGVNWTLSVKEDCYYRGGMLGGVIEAFETSGGESGFNPSTYILTSKDGTQYEYTQDGGLQSITDTNGNVVTVTEDGLFHSSGGGVTFERDARGRIIKVTDNMGAEVTYTYDKDGNLASYSNQIDSKTGKASQTYVYKDNPAHFLEEIYDEEGVRAFKAEFDDSGRLTGSTDALGNVSQQEFDPGAMMVTSKDANGNETVIYYDESGNVTQETVKGVVNVLTGETTSYTKSYEYGDEDNPTKETRIVDYDGTVTVNEYDEAGNQTQGMKISADGTKSTYSEIEYNDNNQRIRETVSNISVFTIYDKNGNSTNITDSFGDEFSYEFNSYGKPTTGTDANGNVTYYEYPSVCPCTTPKLERRPDGSYITRSWNRNSDITSEKYYNSDGTLVYSILTDYDDLNRVIRYTVGDGTNVYIVEYTYKGGSENKATETIVNTTDSSKNLTTYKFYDANGNLTRQVDPGLDVNDPNAGVFYIYDGKGNLVWQMDSVGNVTTWIYDAFDRVVEERDALYWEGTDWSSMTESEIRSFISVITPPPADGIYDPSHITRYVYDGVGNIIEKIDPNGRRITYEYDYLGDVTREVWYDEATDSNAVYEINYTYDDYGKLLSASSSEAVYTLIYNDDATLKSVSVDYPWAENFDTFTLSYTYDAMGNVLSITDSTGVSQVNTYDSLNRLASTAWQGDGVDNILVDIEYNAYDQITSIYRWNDAERTVSAGTTEYTYNTAGQAEKIVHRNALGEILADYDYEYDFAGRLTSEVLNHIENGWSRTANYSYNELGQLIAAFYDNGQTDEHFSWDSNGNSTLPGSVIGTGNRLLSDGTFNYTYDNAGNMISKTRINVVSGESNYTEYEYDYNNQLTRVTEYSSKGGLVLHEETYRYDMFKRRIETMSDGVEEISVYSSISYLMNSSIYGEDVTKVLSNEWARFGSSGEVIQRFLFTNSVDQILAQWTKEDCTLWTLTDRLGSVRDLVNMAGQIIQHIDYSAFGNPIYKNPISLTSQLYRHFYGFTGRVHDNLAGLMYYRARTFNPLTGKFMSQDPLKFAAGDMNLFRYVKNSPFAGTDPSGNCVLIEYCVILTMINVFAGVLAWVRDVKQINQCFISEGRSDRDRFAGNMIVTLFDLLLVPIGLSLVFLMYPAAAVAISVALSVAGILGSYTGIPLSIADLVCLLA